MTSDHPTLRKAAVLVSTLDTDAADALLDQMPAEQAAQVRRLMVELGEVAAEEQEEVIAEFVRLGAGAAGGVELDPSLARRLEQTHRRDDFPNDDRQVDLDEAPPFDFLRRAPGEKLSPLLASERPQTIALVVSHLAPDRAASLLATLPGAIQSEVLRRLVDLDEADPTILREVERGLESRILEQVRTERRRAAGVAAVAGILSAAPAHVQRELLGNLSIHDRRLADRLAPPPFEFEALEGLTNASLARLLSAADPEVVVLSLVDVPASLGARFVALLPGPLARRVRRGLDNLGPVRLSDVAEAQRSLVQLAQELEAEGQLELPRAESLTGSL